MKYATVEGNAYKLYNVNRETNESYAPQRKVQKPAKKDGYSVAFYLFVFPFNFPFL